MTQRHLDSGYVLDDDPTRIDVDAAHSFIAHESYWAKGRERLVMAELVAGAARVVGVYASDETMVGFARAVSDGHTFAWLADVYVLHQHRGHGLGVELVREMVDNGPFAHLRWMLGTHDAHDLYRRFGFAEPTYRIMERRRAEHRSDPTHEQVRAPH
jgi:GNAT superfamily N-acetyltransferase